MDAGAAVRVVVICPSDGQHDRRAVVALRIDGEIVTLESGAITETGAPIEDIRSILHTAGVRVIDLEAELARREGR